MTTTIGQQVGDARSGEAGDRGLTPAVVEAHLLAQDAVLIDLREPDELEEHGRIAGAIAVPRDLLERCADPASPGRLPELDRRRLTIVYDSAGHHADRDVDTLRALGYPEVSHLAGGMVAWKQAGLPVTGLEPWHHITDGRR